jgi:hypothetical protein
MNLKVRDALLAGIAVTLMAVSTPGLAAAAAAAPAGLRAGAARVESTPAMTDLLPPYKSIHDPLFVRALVLDDGTSRAAIVVLDAPTIASPELADMQGRVAKETGAPLANVLVAVTHNHNAIRIDHVVQGVYLPGSPKIADFTIAKTMEAVKQAVANLQPARAGFASGNTPLIGRRAATGPGETDVFDKSLSVFKVESLTGQPIAFLINSGMEPVITQAAASEISADLAGAVERYVEQRYGDKAVAMYTVGSIANSYYNARAQGPTPAANPFTIMSAVGTLLGEDVLATAAQIRPSADLKISAAKHLLTCPGKETTPLNNPRTCSDAPGATLPRCVFTDKDSSAATLQMGLLKIGDLRILQADANITPPVWLRGKAGFPANTILVSLIYGPVRYVLEDAVYPSNSYQATASMVKPGCAAQGFIDNSLQMINASR